MRKSQPFPPADGYALGSDAERARRLAMLGDVHIAPLTTFVRGVRALRPGDRVPYFDPLDGGTNAEVLFLLEAPGPKVTSRVSCRGTTRTRPHATCVHSSSKRGSSRQRPLKLSTKAFSMGLPGRMKLSCTCRSCAQASTARLQNRDCCRSE